MSTKQDETAINTFRSVRLLDVVNFCKSAQLSSSQVNELCRHFDFEEPEVYDRYTPDK